MPSSTPSVWTTPVTGHQRLDPRSHKLVRGLVHTVDQGIASGLSPWIAIKKCAAHIYTVPRDQPTRRVRLPNPKLPARRSLQRAFDHVPIPRNAVPSDCPDAVVIVRQPSTDRLWELWRARREADGWHADWGGATEHASTNYGSYGPTDWPGAQYYWGVSASSMTLLGGTIRLREFRRGEIDHAIALTLPHIAAGEWAFPAQRSDGDSHAHDALPYGAHLRLAPSVDVDALHVPPATKMLLHAIQTYGLIVREQNHWCVQLAAEAPPANDPGFYQRVLGGYPGPIMRAIPWGKLQLLKMDLRSKPGPATPRSRH